MVGLQFYIERSCYGSRCNPALSMPCFGIAKGKCGFLKMYDITRNISLDSYAMYDRDKNLY